MRPRSSSGGRNKSASVTVTVYSYTVCPVKVSLFKVRQNIQEYFIFRQKKINIWGEKTEFLRPYPGKIVRTKISAVQRTTPTVTK